MDGLAALAADLEYAAGQGAEKLKAQVTHGATTKSEIGITLPGGSGLLSRGPQSPAADLQSSPAELAASMATHAADKGVELIVKGQA